MPQLMKVLPSLRRWTSSHPFPSPSRSWLGRKWPPDRPPPETHKTSETTIRAVKPKTPSEMPSLDTPGLDRMRSIRMRCPQGPCQHKTPFWPSWPLACFHPLGLQTEEPNHRSWCPSWPLPSLLRLRRSPEDPWSGSLLSRWHELSSRDPTTWRCHCPRKRHPPPAACTTRHRPEWPHHPPQSSPLEASRSSSLVAANQLELQSAWHRWKAHHHPSSALFASPCAGFGCVGLLPPHHLGSTGLLVVLGCWRGRASKQDMSSMWDLVLFIIPTQIWILYCTFLLGTVPIPPDPAVCSCVFFCVSVSGDLCRLHLWSGSCWRPRRCGAGPHPGSGSHTRRAPGHRLRGDARGDTFSGGGHYWRSVLAPFVVRCPLVTFVSSDRSTRTARSYGSGSVRSAPSIT